MSGRTARIVDLLADQRRFWGASACLFAALALLKGIRLPSRWAATQGFLDYGQGFIKRGLFGETLSLLQVPAGHYDAFVTVSALLFLLFGVLLVSWIRMSGVWRLDEGAVVALFAGSYGLTYLAQLIGYLEIPAAILVLAALLGRGRLPYVLLAGIIGILLHESYLITFLPVTLLPMFLSAATRGSWRDLSPLGVVLLVMLVVAIAVALGAPLTGQQVGKLRTAMSVSADFPLREDFFPVLVRSAADNIEIMLREMGKGRWWLAQANALIAFMPTAALYVWLALRISASRQWALNAGVVRAVIVAVALCPLSLQLFGWDIYRWYALAQLTSLLTLSIVYWHIQPAQLLCSRPALALRNLVILLVAINLTTGTTLFGGYHVDTFPFVDHWRALAQGFAQGLHWPRPAD